MQTHKKATRIVVKAPQASGVIGLLRVRTGFHFYQSYSVVGILSERLYKVRSSPLTLYTDGRKTVPGWGTVWQGLGVAIRYIASGFLRLAICVLIRSRGQSLED